mgnify:CR=1 FL=1
MPAPGFVARATALAAVGLLGVSGCSSDSHASVGAAELQRALVDKLAQAGTPSTWVNCGKDLPGRVGATTRCDVSFDQANSITAILTTTEVKEDNVTWEVTRPEMTKDQVARRVAGLWQTDTVTCSSGLDGNIGDWAQCEVTKYGTPMTQTLEIKAVQGLSLDITPTLAVQKQQAEDFIRNGLTHPDAQPLESVTCPGDLVGTSGTTMDCAVTIAGRQDTYTLSISDAGNGTVDFAVQSGATPAVPAVGISNFDNTRKIAFNLRSTYALTKQWDLIAGYAFERFRFSDIAYDNYQYTIGTGTGASYLSGYYANPNYTVNLVYLVGTYKF